jgi:hypothetical protein
MDNPYGWIELFFGGIFVTLGIVAIVRRRIVIPSRWNFHIHIVKLSGRAALIFGIFQVIGGTFIGLYFIFYWLGDTLSSDFLLSLPVIGLLIVITAFSAAIVINPVLVNRSSDIQAFHQLESVYPWIRKRDLDEEQLAIVDNEAIIVFDIDEVQPSNDENTAM